MNEQEPLIEEPRLIDNLCSTFYLGVGFELVNRNRGAPGIDGVSIADFEANLDEELSRLQQVLAAAKKRGYLAASVGGEEAPICGAVFGRKAPERKGRRVALSVW